MFRAEFLRSINWSPESTFAFLFKYKFDSKSQYLLLLLEVLVYIEAVKTNNLNRRDNLRFNRTLSTSSFTSIAIILLQMQFQAGREDYSSSCWSSAWRSLWCDLLILLVHCESVSQYDISQWSWLHSNKIHLFQTEFVGSFTMFVYFRQKQFDSTYHIF